MLKGRCIICKLVGTLVIIGALNWGLVGLFQFDLVAALFGAMSLVSRAIYAIVGAAGVMMLITCLKDCPKCKQ